MRIPLSLPSAGDRLFDVVGLGLNSIDMLAVVREFPQPNSKQRLVRFARLPGGQAATAMVTCARLGWRVRYIGAFGDDELGALGRQSLIAEHVDISAASTIKGATNQFAIILVEERTGNRTIMFDRDPSLTIEPSDVSPNAVTSARVLLVDCHETAAAARAAALARAASMPTVVDVERVRPGIDGLLRQIDVIIAAEEFPAALMGVGDLGRALARMATEFGAKVACVTLGEQGSLAWSQGKEIRTPAFQVDVADTTGAGDVFRGGFIAGWLQMGETADLEDVFRYANAVAALKCRALGARTGIPTRSEVDSLLNSLSF
ncbi:MAG: hypothetical protein HYX76_09380 [Acidobacteria bacterium]|nr:hypothetical protein [Acidobacteriota bacterium]